MAEEIKKEYDIVFKNKYLDELGIKPENYGTNFLYKDDERLERFAKEREEYGFDSRETWCLDSVFAEWLYTRCKMYLDTAQVSLDFHKFKYKEKMITQEEAIKKIIKWTEFYILHKNDCNENETKAYKKLIKAAKLWAKILPCMWW